MLLTISEGRIKAKEKPLRKCQGVLEVPLDSTAVNERGRCWSFNNCPPQNQLVQEVDAIEFLLGSVLVRYLFVTHTSVVSDSVRPPRWQPTSLSRPWDSPGNLDQLPSLEQELVDLNIDLKGIPGHSDTWVTISAA